MDTVAIPQTLHLRPIQLTAVPVKLKVTVAPDTSELPAVPPLKAATSGPRRTQASAGPATTAALSSSKRWVPPGGGDASTVNALALVAVPAGVVTRIGPVVAPAGTSARIEVAESTMKPALTVLKVSAVAPAELVPGAVTMGPAGPLVGVKFAVVGVVSGRLNLTVLSVLVDAVLVLPAASCATPAAIV